jgi:hypothetical protein
MACPTCGGSQRRALAPGIWVCESPVTELFQMPRPFDLVGPTPVGASTRTCGVRYQEGPTVTGEAPPTCACGIFAVGACTECGQPVCVDCLQRVEGRVMCADDAQRVRLVSNASILAAHESDRLRRAVAAAASAAASRDRGEEARLKIPALLEQLRAAGSPGSVLVPMTTWQLKKRTLRSDTMEPTVTQLRAWRIATTYSYRHLPSYDRAVSVDVTLYVDEHRRYFTTWQRSDDPSAPPPQVDDALDTPLQELQATWTARANEKEGPVKVRGHAFDEHYVARWGQVYDALAAHLPGGAAAP